MATKFVNRLLLHFTFLQTSPSDNSSFVYVDPRASRQTALIFQTTTEPLLGKPEIHGITVIQEKRQTKPKAS